MYSTTFICTLTTIATQFKHSRYFIYLKETLGHELKDAGQSISQAAFH